MRAVINFSQKQTFLAPLQTQAKAMYLYTETGLYCIVLPLYVRMYVRTFTSAGKDAVKLDTFPRTLARQAVTGSVAYAKMSLQGERCALI